jgi:formylglycine-generating enzyme required for sulfatase activity
MHRRWTFSRRALTFLVAFVAAGCSAILAIPDSIDYGRVAPPVEGGVGARDGETDADAGPAPGAARGPNCDGLAPVCGGDARQDCCASGVVEGGEFIRAYDGVDGGPFVTTPLVATVSSFSLDTYEVTVGRFRPFVAAYPASLPQAGDGKNPSDPTDPGWNAAWTAGMVRPTSGVCEGTPLWTDAPSTADKLPMNCVSWFEAFAFCIWDGGRLPTEAEWNYAAAGGSEQRAYPWSVPPTDVTIDRTRAVFDVHQAERVGSVPDGRGRYGQLDLAGNVSEWVVDCRENIGSPPLVPCNDCALRTATPVSCGIHGGSWVDDSTSLTLRAAGRRSLEPSRRANITGFRCARAR